MLLQILEAKRSTKRIISVFYDIVIICFSLYLALTLRLGDLTHEITPALAYSAGITTLATILSFVKLGLYRAILRFATLDAIINVSIGVAISAITLATCSFFLDLKIPRSTPIIFFLSSLLLLGAPRLLFRSLLNLVNSRLKDNKSTTPVVIYGAGYTGYQLALALEAENTEYCVAAFIDDNKKLHGSKVRGIQTFHSKHLEKLKSELNVSTVLLALGQTPRTQKSEIVSRLERAKLKPLTIPPVQDIISGKANISDIKPVAIEDLLGRDPIPANPDLMHACISNQNILVTGAGGSIGSELCRQIILQKPNRILLLERNEYNLYRIEQELVQTIKTKDLAVEIIAALGSVLEQERLSSVMRKHDIHTVYHAAAYKHVPLVEKNITEGVRNNALGTWYCAEAAITANVKSFVLISTDKAVRPTNIMGASKRMAELTLQGLAQRQTSTRFTMVRFGNVLGSSGSVVPLFRKQIELGGPITVTHPDIIRYFMTIPEAAELVIQAGSMGKGGDVFVLDMGEPVKILELATRMVHLSGLEVKNVKHPFGDIEIQFSGLRPGEKLFEELLIGDNVSGTDHPRIMRAEEKSLSWQQTEILLKNIERACKEHSCEKLADLLLQAPTDYEPDSTTDKANKPQKLKLIQA